MARGGKGEARGRFVCHPGVWGGKQSVPLPPLAILKLFLYLDSPPVYNSTVYGRRLSVWKPVAKGIKVIVFSHYYGVGITVKYWRRSFIRGETLG